MASPLLSQRLDGSALVGPIFPLKSEHSIMASPLLSQTLARSAMASPLLFSPDPNSTAAMVADTQRRRRFLTPRVKRRRRSEIEGTSPGTPAARVDLAAVAGRSAAALTLLLVEVHVTTRQALLPDPELDPVTALFYRMVVEGEEGVVAGAVVVGGGRVEGVARVRRVATEGELLRTVVRLVRDADPDVLGGWEVQQASWGFLLARAAALGTNLCPLLSRVPASTRESRMAGLGGEEEHAGAEYQAATTSEIALVGRVVWNVWRMLKAEVNLTSYTLESVARAVLGERRPTFPPRALTEWWADPRTRPRALEHYLGRLHTTAAILARLDLPSRTCELARLFGIQLAEVASRGSQFRVESSMLRLAKPANFVPVSPSRQQLGAQDAPEYLALLLEPESKLYTDPVVVLDFASLYPSIMIAYNYCFTTCLGRVQRLAAAGPQPFGCAELATSLERLEALRGLVTVSPGGVVFLKRGVRRGVLPQMLEDILDTRCMVKASMKKHKSDPQIQKLLHARQLGLKLIANVTYGYTSANFSGRMPCIEVGDSVVSKGREALELAIRTIEDHPTWDARVVYGDTDSVFVLLKGRTKAQAFDLGEEMARVVTLQNPKPMKLKFEKVYLPCLLQTKKRYVGYMWETREQARAVYDAKGIETVRRDGVPATVKILEKTLRILFDTADLSLVKRYVQAQFRKVLSGLVAVQEVTFAKEFRGIGGYRPGAMVPALELTRWAASPSFTPPPPSPLIPPPQAGHASGPARGAEGRGAGALRGGLWRAGAQPDTAGQVGLRRGSWFYRVFR